MNINKMKKAIYALVHIVVPCSFLVVSIAWVHFISNKPLLENVSDHLGILAIWYIGFSVFWYFNYDFIDSQVEKIINEKEGRN
ncbi:hypothetical protein [Bacillus suaedae]|uniref:Uncharacterized protein n=1 Tax=Halalkalibacter suaedae TaxID=2822140 RepID=A0A940WNL3_9BACI|nr:hypothetical protein [Bacillus suaedae]MBP3949546.1 hypothetical protein [Bacillus suaedae]